MSSNPLLNLDDDEKSDGDRFKNSVSPTHRVEGKSLISFGRSLWKPSVKVLSFAHLYSQA